MNGGGNQKPKSNWQSDLGDFLQNALVGTAAALVPGFGIGFAESQQAEREAEMKQLAAREKALFTIAGQAANLGNVAGVEALAPLFQDQQIAQAFLGQAQQTQRLIGGAPGAFVPTAGAEGETRELVTPTGGIVRAGEVGVRPPPEPQFEPTFTPSGTRFAPIPAEKLRFREETAVRKWITTAQNDFLDQGLDLTSAQAAAVQAARMEGKPIPRDMRELLDVPVMFQRQQVPTAAMRRIGAEVEARSEAERLVERRRPARSGQFVDPETFEILPSQLPQGELQQRGAIRINAKQASELRAASTMEGIAKDLRDAVAVLFTTDNPAEAFKRALKFRVAGKTRGLVSITGNPQKDKEILRAVTRLQSLSADIGQLARSRSGEVGVLTQQDIERVFEAVPGLRKGTLERLFETRETAAELLRGLDERIVYQKSAILGLGSSSAQQPLVAPPSTQPNAFGQVPPQPPAAAPTPAAPVQRTTPSGLTFTVTPLP